METMKYKTLNIAAPFRDSLTLWHKEKELSQSLLGSLSSHLSDERSGKTMEGRGHMIGQYREDSSTDNKLWKKAEGSFWIFSSVTVNTELSEKLLRLRKDNI
jgi:hypothetical protein